MKTCMASCTSRMAPQEAMSPVDWQFSLALVATNSLASRSAGLRFVGVWGLKGLRGAGFGVPDLWCGLLRWVRFSRLR